MRSINIFCVFILLISSSWSLFAAPAINPANGHAYGVVPIGDTSFDDAKALAEIMEFNGVNGHLVSITSAQEQAFVSSLSPPVGAWIGAFQADNSVEPAGGWTWITGEPWAYTSWDPGEPNDANDDEDCGHWWFSGGWNDIDCESEQNYMIVEWDTVALPVPAGSRWSQMLLVAGLLLLGAGALQARHRS